MSSPLPGTHTKRFVCFRLHISPNPSFSHLRLSGTQSANAELWLALQILASASYDSYIHLAYDDPDSDWCIFQKLHPSLPSTPLTIPSTFPSHLIDALVPTEEEKKAEAELQVPPLEEDETVWCLAWSPDGRWLASGGDNGGIRLWRRTYVSFLYTVEGLVSMVTNY